MTEPIEKITDENFKNCLNDPDCAIGTVGYFDEKGTHSRPVFLENLDKPYIQALLSSAEKDARIKALEEDIKFRDIDCGCNARIVERDAKIKELEAFAKGLYFHIESGWYDGACEKCVGRETGFDFICDWHKAEDLFGKKK